MRWVKRLGALAIVAIAAVALWSYHSLTASLPRVDGDVAVSGLSAPVTIERDALGVATITGSHRLDVGRALGFVHAQERFFQMDLQRRRAAGELAELVGAGALPLDRHHRVHRMRARAERAVAASDDSERALLNAYTEGVNAGLAALGAPPFAYLLLRLDPEPWRAEDSVLVVASMFFQLNDENGGYEATFGLLHDVLPSELATFLAPWGTEWDAPVTGEAYATPPIPGPGIVELEAASPSPRPNGLPRESMGSNNWAVSGALTAHGGALLASDMHLGHSVPNIWYRALLRWESESAVGVTLPGTPFLVAGSNSRIAWGFTNSNGDWIDLVEIEVDPDDPDRYRTPNGWKRVEVTRETINVGEDDHETIEVRETIWGPIIDADHHGTPRAVRWIAHEVDAINMTLGRLETATTLDEAIAIARRSGLPPQNFVCVDASGDIGWTVAGRIPRRFGFDGRLPSSWADGTRGWNGWLAPKDYPVIRNPDSGVIWTANARVVDGAMLEVIGDGGYAFGARARQIRDDLLALERPSESDMLAVQLDDRALFMGVWRDYFLEWIDDDELRRILEDGWTGRASIDSAAYRIVRELRLAIFAEVFGVLTQKARRADDRFDVWSLRQWDGPLLKLVTERPEHLVPSPHESWDQWMADIVRRTVAGWDEPLEARTWGKATMSQIRHPLSAAVPLLSRWLDMPSRPLPGDSNMPRVQSPTHGASERFVVSPGREEEALLHMPGGQSGHPLSPYYGAGHDAWEQGLPTPLLPGETEYTLTLEPRSE